MSPEHPCESEEWSMYPEHHPEVADALLENGLDYEFHKEDDPDSCIRDYVTHIRGRFTCNNLKCSGPPERPNNYRHAWFSSMVSVVIRKYRRYEYNVRVHHQGCEFCLVLQRPSLDVQTYIDRVVYRLKKWAGINVTPPPWTPALLGHVRGLCAGCWAGRCLDDACFHVDSDRESNSGLEFKPESAPNPNSCLNSVDFWFSTVPESRTTLDPGSEPSEVPLSTLQEESKQ